MSEEKKRRGGARPGSGRKRIEDTETVSFRVSSDGLATCREILAERNENLNTHVNKFIKSLAKRLKKKK